MPIIDLHCHTTASDGLLSPAELVERAASDGVDVIAVTDHDTTSGIAEAVAASADGGVRVIAGIELSARHGSRNVHVLGYFVDPTSPTLVSTLSRLSEDRSRRAVGMVEKLVALGYEITIDDVAAQAPSGLIARPHVARALVARGYIGSVTEAFTADLIADGGRADVPKQALTPEQAVRLVVCVGGAAVVAHPGVGHHDGQIQPLSLELFDRMRSAGLVGIEVDHPDHPPLVRERLVAVAAELGLVATGGSDFHGEEGHVLGRWRTRPEALAQLEAMAGG